MYLALLRKPTLATDDPLWSAIQSARAKWSPDAPERSPLKSPWGPLAPSGGDRQPLMAQGFAAAVPTVPTVPTENKYIPPRTPADVLHDWEERAAIIEYEGGYSRADAERMATEALGSLPPQG